MKYTLGENMKKRRQSLNMTQDELGKILGIKKNTISNWETGRSSPDVNMLAPICVALHISADELLDFPLDPNTMSGEELAHIEQYRNLDRRGRAVVDNVTKTELEFAQS